MSGTSVSAAPAVRAAVPFAFLGLGAIVAVGAYLRFVSSSAFGIDLWWGGIVRLTRGSAPYAVAVFCAEVGTAVGVAALGAVAMALLFATRRPRDAAAVGTSLLIGVAGSELLKSLVLRPRPEHAIYSAHGSSFPSGHSMGAAALACSLALVVHCSDDVAARTRRLAWMVAAAWALLMMWSRTALGVHWLSDTICGALLGVAAALLGRRIWTGRGPSGRARTVG
ncbi:phosphatase PAP2 family protein [Leucobacter ruminantium]|uniref:Phosphatase PAP2 family protein n=1 Tax=Leucobacter ruminantium TaxID=1289170 RepID=A0A939LX93_9MICO|nr:phosphatase PAP2 family protein [Leucobacter ruminantium]MBO1804077.1 phosphatase PAP2 family protein [Leucobacter ruminantium]